MPRRAGPDVACDEQSNTDDVPGGRTAPRFVWPPNRAETDAEREEAPDLAPPELVDRAPVRAAGLAATWAAGWASVERELLGVRDLSFERRARAEGYTGDDALSVCWRCGTTVGPHEADGDGCSSCRPRRLQWSRFVRVGSYEGLLRDAVLELKFEQAHSVGREVGARLGRSIRAELDRLGISAQEARIVPVPMPWVRRMQRGVDHTLVLARSAARASAVPVARVLRARVGPRQVGRARQDRLGGLSRRFQRISTPAMVVKVWIVVDDVRTTGATMSAACRVLRLGERGGAGSRVPVDKVWAAVVGVTPDRGRRREGGVADGGT